MDMSEEQTKIDGSHKLPIQRRKRGKPKRYLETKQYHKESYKMEIRNTKTIREKD